MRSRSPLSNLKSSWRRLMILVRHIEPVVNNQPSFTSSWTIWTRSILCTNSLLTGTKLSSWDLLKSPENWCSKIELRASPSITLCRSTNKLADHCSKKISFYSPCKCALLFRLMLMRWILMNGTSSWEVDKFLIDLLRHQNHHLIGSLNKLGIILPSWRRLFQRLSLESPMQFPLTTRNGSDGSYQCTHLHQRQLNSLENGKPNAMINSRKWSY
jgi:hypothetical protein